MAARDTRGHPSLREQPDVDAYVAPIQGDVGTYSRVRPQEVAAAASLALGPFAYDEAAAQGAVIVERFGPWRSR